MFNHCVTRSFRALLLAGVSTLALSAAASAQGISVSPAPGGNDPVRTTSTGQLITGNNSNSNPIQSFIATDLNGNTIRYGTIGGEARIVTRNPVSGVEASLNSASGEVASIGANGSIGFTPDKFITTRGSANGFELTSQIDSATGHARFGGATNNPAAAPSGLTYNNAGLGVRDGVFVEGGAQINGGAVINGQTTTTTLDVNGQSTFGTADQTKILANGNIDTTATGIFRTGVDNTTTITGDGVKVDSGGSGRVTSVNTNEIRLSNTARGGSNTDIVLNNGTSASLSVGTGNGSSQITQGGATFTATNGEVNSINSTTGQVKVGGGTYTGNASGLTSSNAGLVVENGAHIRNGLNVDSLRASTGTVTTLNSTTATIGTANIGVSYTGVANSLFSNSLVSNSLVSNSVNTNVLNDLRVGDDARIGDRLTVGGLSQLNGGLNVVGATNLNGATTITGNGTNALTVNSGLSTFNGNTKTTGNTETTGNTKTGSLTVTGASTFGSSANGATTIGADGTIFVPKTGGGNGGTTINGSGIKVGATTTIDAATGTVTVNSSGPANRQTVLNGTNGNVSVGGNLSVEANRDVFFGNNRVQGVATPILGTDATNKDYVDAADRILSRRIDEAKEGVAIAMSIQNPDLIAGERFGVSVNWGNFEGSNAFGVAAAGVVGHNFLGSGERMAVTGGFGVGTEKNSLGGRAGVQFTW